MTPQALRPLLALALLSGACSSSLPAPPRGAHPANAAMVDVVEYPPPPAQSEVVPPAPDNPRCVWLDGHWDWLGGRWQWIRGAWIVAPDGCFFAPPSLYWLGSGLSFLRPHWYPNNAEDLPPDKARSACGKPSPCGRDAQKYQPGG